MLVLIWIAFSPDQIYCVASGILALGAKKEPLDRNELLGCDESRAG